MLDISIFPLNFNQYHVPLTYEYGEGFTLAIAEDKEIIFTCRLYRFNAKICNATYELADVFLYEQYRGRTDNTGTKYSKLCLELVDSYLTDNKIYDLVLWTTRDNIKAISRYTELGFSVTTNEKVNEYYKTLASHLNIIVMSRENIK